MKKVNPRPIDHPEQMSSYWKREWKILGLVAVPGIIFNMGMSYVAILQGQLIDALVEQEGGRSIIKAVVTYLIVLLTVQLFRYCKRYYVRVFANRTSATMRLMIYNQMMHESLQDLKQESTGDLMSKAVGDVDICAEGMRKVTTEIFDTGVLMGTYFVTLLFYDVRGTLLACAFIPVAILIAGRMKQKIVDRNKEARRQNSVVTELTKSNVENEMLFRAYGARAGVTARYDRELRELEQKNTTAAVLENVMQPVYQLIAMLGMIVVIIVCGRHVIAGTWTVGMFSTYATIFTALATKTGKAAKLFNSYQKAVVSWQRVKPHMKAYQSHRDVVKPENMNNRLEVSNVSFTWPGSDKKVVHGVSFTAEAGDIIGVTGPVACGKTSLGVALLGIYPYEGSIRVNGRELRDCAEEEKAALRSYLGHKPELLSASIEENIAMGLVEKEQEKQRVGEVLEDVCFGPDLAGMAEGMEEKVGANGVRLSGGQQQRIALARALYYDRPVLILDDPFASVDQKTEKELMRHLREHYADRIILLISHRLVSFPQTRKVLFLHEDGQILQGTHEELLRMDHQYRALYEAQQGGGQG